MGEMLGRKERDQTELFITGSLRQLVPDEHILARVDRVLDLSWLRNEVADLYCIDNGRPGIDPEVAVRLMLAGFLLGLVHDRRLMREAQVNIAIRWFVGYGLHEVLPDHSSLTRIRQRWGAERFRRIFERTVKACIAAKIATGEIVHIDASLIRADVSWESLVQRHADEVDRANPPTDEEEAEKKGKQSGKFKKVSMTDPDASMATNARNRRLEPCYKQHAVVDDVRGVIVDVDVTTGEINEGQLIEERVDATMATTGTAIATVTADAGYAYAKVYGAMERRGIDAVIPAKADPMRSAVPLRRFKFDPRTDRVKCPQGKILTPGKVHKHGRFFTARVHDCRSCPLAAPAERPDGAGSHDQHRLSGPATSSAAPGSLVRRRPTPVQAPQVALRRLPRRGEDLAWAGTRCPAWNPQHEDPGLPDRSGDQPEAARRCPFCAHSDPCRAPRPSPGHHDANAA